MSAITSVLSDNCINVIARNKIWQFSIFITLALVCALLLMTGNIWPLGEREEIRAGHRQLRWTQWFYMGFHNMRVT